MSTTDGSTPVDEGLFEMAHAKFEVGDTVVVQTMWGYEPCVVVAVGRDRQGHPIATLDAAKGDRLTVSIARVAGVVHEAP